MDEIDLEGVVRGKRKPITTMPTEVDTRPADLVERNFVAAAPNGLWVADLTYVSTWNGFCYVALVVDLFSRFIVVWVVGDHEVELFVRVCGQPHARNAGFDSARASEVVMVGSSDDEHTPNARTIADSAELVLGAEIQVVEAACQFVFCE